MAAPTVVTNDADALYQAILARRDDDLPRLVYADWLEEHGDPRAPWVRNADIWVYMAPDAASPVPRLLADGRWDLLGRIGRTAVVEAIPALVEALGHTDALDNGNYDVWKEAVYALGRLDSTAAVPVLAYALRNRNPGVRELVAEELKQFGREAAVAVPNLTHALSDEDDYVRLSAVKALGAIGPAAASSLVHALQNDVFVVRLFAVTAVREVGPAVAAEVLPALRLFVRTEPTSTVREAAEEVIERIAAERGDVSP